MVCLSTYPGARCHFCKAGKRRCQHSAKPLPDESAVTKMKKERANVDTKKVDLRSVKRTTAKREPAPVAGPSRFTGSMSVDVPAVRGQGVVRYQQPGLNVEGEPIPVRYTKDWDFGAVGDDGRERLARIRSRIRFLTGEIDVLKMELRLMREAEEAMFDARKEADEEMFDGEFEDAEGAQ